MEGGTGRCVALFISDHGLGHAARSCCIVRALQRTGCRVILVTGVPRWFLDEAIALKTSPESGTKQGSRETQTRASLRTERRLEGTPNEYLLLSCKVDVGFVQSSSISIDAAATAETLHEYWATMEQRVLSVTQALQGQTIDTVYTDVTPLACFIARRLGVPCVIGSNFTWSGIYRGAIREDPQTYERLTPFVSLYENAYAHASAIMAMPFSLEELGACANKPLPRFNLQGLLCRRATSNRDDTRQLLGCIAAERSGSGTTWQNIMLYSFGGFQMAEVARCAQQWEVPHHWLLVYVDLHDVFKEVQLPSNVLVLSNEFLLGAGLHYVDLVNAADTVLLKTGWGIVSECIAHRVKGVLYVDRPGFEEHKWLVRALHENVSAKEVSIGEAMSANVFATADQVIQVQAEPVVPLDGSDTAARFILGVKGGSAMA